MVIVVKDTELYNRCPCLRKGLIAQLVSQQRPHKPKVAGSSPAEPTMKKEISEFYKRKGFKAVYVATNKEPRRVATLLHNDGHLTSMSYAKYLYTSYYECDVPTTDHVDHINGKRMDDRIENLQVISGAYNRQKDHSHKEMVIVECPVCGKEFLFDKRNIPFKRWPCCSRRCGGIKSHWIIA